MDPLEEISEDIHFLVLQHLSVLDILEASTVSSVWYEKLGESATCMQKVKLSLKIAKGPAISKQQQQDDMLEVMQSTSRRYQNLALDCRYDEDFSKEAWKFLKHLAPFVTELRIKSIKMDSQSSIVLPRLKVLRLTYVRAPIRNVLLASSKSFTKLKLKTELPFQWGEKSKPDQESLACIRSCMENNMERLQELELVGSHQYKSFFTDDFSDIVRFRLKALKVKTDMRLVLISETNEANFIKFLATQSCCLETIFIDVCRSNVITHIFNHMPALTSIHINLVIMNDFRISDLNLNLNEKVVDLNIPYVVHQEDIIEFLNIAPNITSLFVAHLSYATMDHIARNQMELRSVKYRFGANGVETLYERLKTENPRVNQNIEFIVDFDYI